MINIIIGYLIGIFNIFVLFFIAGALADAVVCK